MIRSSTARSLPLSGRPSARRAQAHVAAPGQLADHHAQLVADQRRVDVLVALGHLGDGRDVDAALVREGAAPDIGRVGVGVEVGDRGDEVRDLAQPGSCSGARHGSRSLSCRLAISGIRSMLPQRSP